jgi:basic membrane lipoprotein Med (substrate-binding protein (PBP1-ABC) superfamily)
MAVVRQVQIRDIVKRVVGVNRIRVGRAYSHTAAGGHIVLQVIDEGAGVVYVLEDVLGSDEIIAAVEH